MRCILSKRSALITGITGMDGSHLADFLLEKSYSVFGTVRRTSQGEKWRLQHITDADDCHFITCDLTDQTSILRALHIARPDEIYNLAAQSFVGASWQIPVQTMDVTSLGAVRLLEAVRTYEMDTKERVRLYQASTSEMFGSNGGLADENTPFAPRSPYAIAKLSAHHMMNNYRESFGMFTCSGILFNHESERRGLEFVTRKITDGISRICHGLADHISLGNLNARRDWGYAPDYVEAMWLMLQQEKPDNYVIATGKSWSIRDFLERAFACVGITDWEKYVRKDPRFFRPTEVDVLCGKANKAMSQLGWSPTVEFDALVERMVQADIDRYRKAQRAEL